MNKELRTKAYEFIKNAGTTVSSFDFTEKTQERPLKDKRRGYYELTK